MKLVLTLILGFGLVTGYSQNRLILDSNYYNSLQWKKDNYLQVYIDCTYSIPTKTQVTKSYYDWGPRYYPVTYSIIYNIPFRSRLHYYRNRRITK